MSQCNISTHISFYIYTNKERQGTLEKIKGKTPSLIKQNTYSFPKYSKPFIQSTTKIRVFSFIYFCYYIKSDQRIKQILNCNMVAVVLLSYVMLLQLT